MTLILGKSIATAKQMSTYLLSVNKTPKFSRNITAEEFCQLFLDISAKEGVRGDMAFAQSCLETGNFTFKGDVKYTQNNFAGIGATGGVPGCNFSSIEEGILAQAQHLKTYATKSALNEPCVDPRRTAWFVNTKGGTAPHVENLSGTWAVPGYDTKRYSSLEAANKAKDSYGYKIVNILDNILKIKVKEDGNMGYTNSPLVDYTRISPNSTNPRKSKIKKIVIHHMAGNLSVETCGNVFANPSRKASANYGVGTDGRVGLYVEECNRAWTSGNATVDNEGVTIEVANDTTGGNWHVSDKALEKTIELCVDICKRNGIEKLEFTGNKNGNLVAHRYYQATLCPGDYLYSKFPYIANEVNKRLGVKVPTITPKPTTETNTYTVQKGDTLSKIGNKTGISWKTIAELNGIKFPYIVRVGQVLKLPTTATTPTSTYTHTQFVKEVQAAIGAKVDGIAGNETLSKTITVSKTKNSRHAVVKPIQKYLASLGYDIGKIDGIAGAKFDKAVKEYQKANTGVIDGEITARSATWKKLLKLI